MARDGNAAVMIADHRLHDGESQPCALKFRRVIRREQARTFFRRQALTRVGHVDSNATLVLRGFECKRSAGGHGVE